MTSLQSINETLLAQGRLDEAVAAYRAVIAQTPESPEAHHFLAIALHRQGRLDEAIAAYRRVAELGPGFAETHCNLGLALMAQGRHEEAANACRRAIALRPDFVEAHNYLGMALQQRGRLDEAVAAYRAALDLRPEYPAVLSNLCVALHALGRYEEAVAAGRRAVEQKADFAEAHNNLGYALEAQGRPGEAIAAYRRALDLAPGYALAQINLGNAQQAQGRLDEAVASYRAALRLDPGHAMAYSNLLLCLNSQAGQDAAATFAEHRQWGDRHGRPAGAGGWLHANDPAPDRRLRIGYVSPAPVQVSYIGYPNTTGLDAIDYRITDALADPEGQDAYYCETLSRLPRCFLCYAPPGDAPAVAPPPAAKAGAVTFGSFNDLRKVTPEVVALWSRVLEVVPAARLVLKAKSLAEDAARQRYYDLFERNGIARQRIDLLGWNPSLGGHLDLYGRVDVALDPFPYNGTTTTCEALWMGVPVVTLEGRVHAGRVGVSLLSAVGLTEFIAPSPGDYVAKAAALAGDLARLSDLRRRLRDMMAGSQLCDAAGLAGALEAAYHDMWQSWCARQRTAPSDAQSGR